jgi:hypothetical protein
MDDKLTTALIAAVVSGLGSGLVARWQIRSKLRELEQIQLKDILAKRMDAYAELWSILQGQVSNWPMEGKPCDGKWALRLYVDLNACHAKWGVFFSKPVYDSFCEVRQAVFDLAKDYDLNDKVPPEAVCALDEIWSAALAAHLKNDLGSFRPTMISLRTE